MDRLRDYTADLMLRMQHEGAWTAMEKHYQDPKNWKRYISGVAISSRQRNANHHAFDARGAQITLPALLLLDHTIMHPMGRITHASVDGEQLKFTAEISNAFGPYWLDQMWPMMAAREVTGISIGPRKSGAELRDGIYRRFTLDEISVVQSGADPSARITKVWERAPAIHLDGRPNQVVHWSE